MVASGGPIRIKLASKLDGNWKLRRIKEPTDDQIAAYESWIGHDWPEKDKPNDKAEPDK